MPIVDEEIHRPGNGLVDQLIQSFWYLADKQSVVEDAHGNVSAMDDSFSSFFIKPSGMEYTSIQPEDVVRVSMGDGKPLPGYTRKPSVDTIHHMAIYRRHPFLKAICHTHSPYATAWAIAGMDMRVSCTEHADYFGHKIDCLEYQDLDSWSDFQMSRGVGAVLLSGHGVLTFSEKGPEHAAKLAVALESIAKKYSIAKQLFQHIPVFSQDEVRKWHERYQNSYGQ